VKLFIVNDAKSQVYIKAEYAPCALKLGIIKLKGKSGEDSLHYSVKEICKDVDQIPTVVPTPVSEEST